MYLGDDGSGGSYTRDGSQAHSRGRFLILLHLDSDDGTKHPMRAIVRKVALRQLGHWMMGTARIAGKSVTISGAYGGDGLGVTVQPEIYALGVDVPPELYEAWNNGGGHNSFGSEAPAMREWACRTFPK